MGERVMRAYGERVVVNRDERRRREICARMYAEPNDDDVESRHVRLDDLTYEPPEPYGEGSFVDAVRPVEKWCA